MPSLMDKRGRSLPWSVFLCLILSACGAGNNSGSVPPLPIARPQSAGLVVAGTVQAPSGQVALFRQPNFWNRLVRVVWPEAVAAVSGLSPVPDGVRVQLGRIDQVGNFIETLAETTVTDGHYSFTLTNLGAGFSNDLAVRVINLSTGLQMRAFAVDANVNIDPVSEAALRLVLDQFVFTAGKTFDQLSVKELRDIRAALNLFTNVKRVPAGLSIESTVAAIVNAVASDEELMDSFVTTLTSGKIFALSQPQGSTVTVSDYADIQTAAPACVDKTLIIPFNTPVSSNTTIGGTCTLWFSDSGRLSVANNVTVTINGPIVAPLARIFTFIGTGRVSLIQNTQVDHVFPQWWGGLPDGSTDNTDALQATVNASAGRTVFLSSGIWVLGNAGANTVPYRNTKHFYCVTLPSNTTLFLDDSATLRQADSTNSHLFINVDISDVIGGGNENIVIKGGTFDLNYANQTNPPTGEQSGGLFHNVRNLTIENVKFTNVREYALRITGIRNSRFVNLSSTDSDGSGFSFGVDSTGWSDFDYGVNDSLFDYIVARNSLGGFTGARGNGFIFHGQRCRIGHVSAYNNAFGIKIQDRSKDIQVDSVIARGTAQDHGFKVQGLSGTGRVQGITIGKVQTTGNYHAGVYLQYAQNVTVGSIDSNGDGISKVYPAIWIGEGQFFKLDSITIGNVDGNRGLLVRPDAQFVTIGQLTVTAPTKP